MRCSVDLALFAKGGSCFFCSLFVCCLLVPLFLFLWSRKMHFFGARLPFAVVALVLRPMGASSRPPLPALFFSRRRRPWRRCPVPAYCGVVHRHGRGDKATLDGVAAALRRRKQDRPHDQDQPRAEPRSRGHCLFPSLLSGVLFAVLSGCPSDRDARSSATRHPFVWAPFPFFFPARPKLRFSRKKKKKKSIPAEERVRVAGLPLSHRRLQARPLSVHSF